MSGWVGYWFNQWKAFYILEGTLDYSILNVIFTWFSPSGFPGRLEYFFPEKGGAEGERNILFSTPFSINEPEFEIFYGQPIPSLFHVDMNQTWFGDR